MSVTVEDLLRLPSLRHAKVLGGAGGLHKVVSSISVLESIVANCVEIFHTDRKKTVVVLSVIYLAASAVIALLSTILIGWVKSPQYVIGEMERNGETFRRRGVYTIMIRYIAPEMMFVLFLQSTGILS